MAACAMFEEDEVYIIDNHGFRCGLVLESAEYASSEEDEDPDYERVEKGSIRVAWHPEGEEQVIEEKSVQLADRSLMPGDVVRRLITGQESQRGYVRDTLVTCHIQVIGQHRVLTNIDSAQLESVLPFETEPGDVAYDCWVGKVDLVNSDITLVFGDSAVCRVVEDKYTSELFRFEDVHDKRKKDSEFANQAFYPGQQLRGNLHDLESAVWVRSTVSHSRTAAHKAAKQKREVTVTVSKVEMKSVDVHWLCRGYDKLDAPNAKMEPPPHRINKNQLHKLKKLDCFSHCSVQIGDKLFYTIKESDIIHTFPARYSRAPLQYVLETERQSLACDEEQVQELRDRVKRSGGAHALSNTSTGIHEGELMADSAREERGESDSSGTAPNDAGQTTEDGDDDAELSALATEKDAAPETSEQSSSTAATTTRRRGKKDRRRARRARAKPSEPLPCRPEVAAGAQMAVEVLYTRTSVEVMWQDGSIEAGVPSTALFPIHHLDELEFFPGDMVIRNTDDAAMQQQYGVVETVAHFDRTCQVLWMRPYTEGQAQQPVASAREEVSVYDIKDHPDYKFRPGHVVVRVGGLAGCEHAAAAGQVVELTPEGRLIVVWADGTRSPHYPQEVYLIGDELAEHDDSLMSSGEDGEDGESAGSEASTVSWETEEEEEQIGEEAGGGEEDAGSALSVEPGQKVELDQLLDTARRTLQKLEDTFAQNVSLQCPAALLHCYREILRIYRNCRHLNRMLDAEYFAAPPLAAVIAAIRRELKKEVADSMARRAAEMFASNCRLEGGDPGAASVDVGPVEGRVSGEAPAPGPMSVDVGPLGGPEVGPVGGLRDLLAQEEAPEPSAPPHPLYLFIEVSGCTQPRELCESACRLLKEQIVRVHHDLETKWDELKAAGKLHIVGESDSDSEDEFESAQQSPPESAATQPSSPPLVALSTTERCQNFDNFESSSPEAAVAVSAPPESDSESSSQDMPSGEQRFRPIRELISSLQPPGGSTEVTGPPLEGRREQLEGLDLDQTPPSSPPPPTPQTPADVRAKVLYNAEGFSVEGEAPKSHRYAASEHAPSNPSAFFSAVRKEMKLLRTSLPIGIFVKGFEDRMDLYSVLIVGPDDTPYEGGVFLFDVQLPADYPSSPPAVHYLSYCQDRLNPNLYEDGKVCVSLLGTWTGRGTEVWHNKSSLLQVLVSIQGLILVREPYYNEAGYEKQRGCQQGCENSRMYNEMVICKLMQSLTRVAQRPPAVFECEVMEHFRRNHVWLVARMRFYIECSERRATECSNALPAATPSGTLGAPLPATPSTVVDSLPPATPSGVVDEPPPATPAGTVDAPTLASSSAKIDSPTEDHTAKSVPSESALSGSGDALSSTSLTDALSGQCAPSGEPAPVALNVWPRSGAAEATLLEPRAVRKHLQFPLLPASRGFCLTLDKHLRELSAALAGLGLDHTASEPRLVTS